MNLLRISALQVVEGAAPGPAELEAIADLLRLRLCIGELDAITWTLRDLSDELEAHAWLLEAEVDPDESLEGQAEPRPLEDLSAALTAVAERLASYVLSGTPSGSALRTTHENGANGPEKADSIMDDARTRSDALIYLDSLRHLALICRDAQPTDALGLLGQLRKWGGRVSDVLAPPQEAQEAPQAPQAPQAPRAPQDPASLPGSVTPDPSASVDPGATQDGSGGAGA